MSRKFRLTTAAEISHDFSHQHPADELVLVDDNDPRFHVYLRHTIRGIEDYIDLQGEYAAIELLDGTLSDHLLNDNTRSNLAVDFIRRDVMGEGRY